MRRIVLLGLLILSACRPESPPLACSAEAGALIVDANKTRDKLGKSPADQPSIDEPITALERN